MITETGLEKLNIPFILFPECGVKTESNKWQEREVGCEDCGSHDGLECPNCQETFDHVFGFDKLLKSSVVSAPDEKSGK